MYKKKSGSKMDLLSISKCAARAFNRSKYCRKSSKNVWIYMSFTTVLNIIKTFPEIHIFFSLHLQKKIWLKMDLLPISKWPARAYNRSNTEENQYRIIGFL
jgi:hypothetical protein